MGGTASGQYGQMVMKIEGNTAMQMEHQQCYSAGQIPMPNTGDCSKQLVITGIFLKVKLSSLPAFYVRFVNI